jgi:glycosyltransferase involved in cell wall biosynthesis
VVAAGGTYSQYLKAPLICRRRFGGWDLVVDVENGLPFFSPLWWRGPSVCLVHHIHSDQWALRFPGPVAALGALLERRVMPIAYRRRLFTAVSPSTAQALEAIGVAPERIRIVPNGVDAPDGEGWPRSASPLFLALGRLVPHKRLDLLLRVWERVRPLTGGRLVIAGDGPDRERLRRLVGEGVELLGRVSEEEKARLLGSAWLLVHPALHEGWGIVVMEAAVFGTPTLGFDVPGVRDAVMDGQTGALVTSEDGLAERWVALASDPARREAMGREARRRAADFDWKRSVDAFLGVAEEAVG